VKRVDDERPDLVYYAVDANAEPARLTILSEGTRMAAAYGHTGESRLLDDDLGPRLAPVVIPFYDECARYAQPVFTIADIDDVHGRVVANEQLLLPFSNDAGVVTDIVELD
jgi:hypothetical protein